MRYDQKYKNYTVPRLLLENALREVPLRLKELCLYAGHKYDSLKVGKNALKRQNRLVDGVVNMSHPDNYALDLHPLEDIKYLPAPNSKINAKAAKEAASLVARAIGAEPGTATVGNLTVGQIKSLLSEYIQMGAGGKDFIASITKYLDLITDRQAIGPPAPLTPAETTDRILRVLTSAAPESVAEAIERYHALNAQESPTDVPEDQTKADTPETEEPVPEAS